MQTTPTLTDRALVLYHDHQAKKTEKEAAELLKQQETLRERFTIALHRALCLPHDDDRLPWDPVRLAWPGAWRETEAGLRWEQDGLRFRPSESYGYDQVLLERPCPECGQSMTEPVQSLLTLGELLALPQAPCFGCRAAAEEAVRIAASPDLSLVRGPAAALNPAEQLAAAVRALIEECLDTDAESQASREYFQSEREANVRRKQAEALSELSERHRSDTLRLEDDLRRVQADLKRQQQRG